MMSEKCYVANFLLKNSQNWWNYKTYRILHGSLNGPVKNFKKLLRFTQNVFEVSPKMVWIMDILKANGPNNYFIWYTYIRRHFIKNIENRILKICKTLAIKNGH